MFHLQAASTGCPQCLDWGYARRFWGALEPAAAVSTLRRASNDLPIRADGPGHFAVVKGSGNTGRGLSLTRRLRSAARRRPRCRGARATGERRECGGTEPEAGFAGSGGMRVAATP